MNFSVDQIISIASAVGISTIIGTIFTFVQSNKKNQLEIVTKERSRWRENLKDIIAELDDESKRKSAIAKLKTQINPYGKKMDIKNTNPYFMRDGHIWDMIENEERIDYEKLSFYIQLLLKYDWERSKKEITIKPLVAIDWMIRVFLFFIGGYLIYEISLKYNQNQSDILAFVNFFLLFISVLLLPFQKIVTKALIFNPSKNENESVSIFLIFYAVPFGIILCNFIYFLKVWSYVLLVVAGIFIYEIYFFSQLYSIDDKYVRELERHYFPRKNPRYQKMIKTQNNIRRLEYKIYYSSIDTNGVTQAKLDKKNKKLKKKFIKSKRPLEPWLHPVLYCSYRKDRKRILKIVKKINR